jgi:hypothetical protein
VDGAATDRDVDVVVGDHTGESLGDAAQLDGDVCSSPRRGAAG